MKPILFNILLISTLFAFKISVSQTNNFDDICNNSSVVILDEKEHITFFSKQISKMQIVVEKEIKYLINDSLGIDYFSKIDFPEQFDEVYKPNCSDVRNVLRVVDRIDLQYYSIENLNKHQVIELSILDFEKKYEKTVINNNESGFIAYLRSDIFVTGQRYANNTINTEQFGDVTIYEYSIKNISIGDTLTIKYKYKARFIDNINIFLNTRKFFHSHFPKRNYELYWTFNNELKVDTFFVNNNTYNVNIDDNNTIIHWHYTNLFPALSEKGSIAHKDLPWFGFFPKTDDFYTTDIDTYESFYMPLFYYYAHHREKKFRKAIIDASIGNKDRDNLSIDRKVKSFKSQTNQDNGPELIRIMQNYMVDSVEYENAYAYYNRDKTNTINHIGKEIERGIVKDNNIEQIYAYWLAKMDYAYFTGYISDNRIGMVDENYFIPINQERMLFIPFVLGKYPMFIYPKGEYNYYADELPFYYEGTKVLLMNSSYFGDVKRNFKKEMEFIFTPKSKLSDNYRMSRSKVTYNKLGELEFNTTLTLSGQYSTLTRPVYLKTNTDKSINKNYLKPVWQITKNTSLEKSTLVDAKKVYPFKFDFALEYKTDEIIEKKSNTIDIDLKGLFNHIIIENLDSSFLNRQTNFYPDFNGRDSYYYVFNFENQVKLISDNEVTSIINDFGTYNFSVKQLSPKSILVTSIFIVKWNFIPKENISYVYDIYKGIQEATNSVLSIKIID